MPISWMLVSIAAIAKLFVTDPNNPLVEVGFAVVLLASLEVSELARSLEQLIKAISSWRLIRPIEQGAKRPDEDQPQEQGVTVVRPVDAEAGRLLLNGYGLNFRYPGRDRAILDRVSLKLHVGERILLEGPSGGGKSTFASLLTGYLTPQSGLLFLWGLDKSIVGTDRWRQWVVYVPQFHQNHIISGTLAFNLLMGRRWPPSPTDLEDAETILSELGMGELLEKMPLGLQQRVGERGWYLSHGERSRLYIARALLQQADLIILDESFASLDPENMAIALRTVLKRAKTLMVIAHP
jgi:ATP-binding cassette subfamily B protein